MKNSRGITLIALVITIIVLLILAGVSIATIMGDDGIIARASQSKENTIIAEDKEKINLTLSEYKLLEIEPGAPTLEELFESKEWCESATLGADTIKIVMTNGREYDVEVDVRKVRFYQPYRVTIEGMTLELVFHEDGSIDLYDFSENFGAKSPAGVTVYGNETINVAGSEGIVGKGGRTLEFTAEDGTQTTLELVPKEKHYIYYDATYSVTIVNSSSTIVGSVILHEDGSIEILTDGNVTGSLGAGTVIFNETSYIFEGKTLPVYPDGTMLIFEDFILELQCPHENTEVQNQTEDYTGDVYCNDCGKIIRRGHGTDAMITTWNVTEAGGYIELPIVKNADYEMDVTTEHEYNFTVDWGDGSEPEVYSSSELPGEVSFIEPSFNINNGVENIAWAPGCDYVAYHTYANAGTYTVEVTGYFDAWWYESWDNAELVSVDDWSSTGTEKYIFNDFTGTFASPDENSFNDCVFQIFGGELSNLPNDLFNGVKELTLDGSTIGSLTISDDVESLYLYGLVVDEITIPKNVENLDVKWSTLYINVDEENSNYASVDGVLYSKDKKTLLFFPNGRTGNFTIPSFVETIETYAFNGDINLDYVKIPSTVKLVKESAFSCSGLKELYIATGITIEESAIIHCDDLQKLYCEDATKPDNWGTYWLNGYSSSTQVVWGYIEEN